jgi:two-component system, LytTR family, response regulator
MPNSDLKVFVVDDEFQSRQLLCNLLTENFNNVTITGEAGNVSEALNGIKNTQPNLLFLDIEMRGETGFDLLQQLGHHNIQVIFVTAHNEYALKAFRYHAIDYLLKPIILSELADAVKNAGSRLPDNNLYSAEQLSNLVRSINSRKNIHDKIAVPTSDGFVLIPVKEIIFCKAVGNYTEFHLLNNKQLLSSYTLKQYHDLLTEKNFLRTHRSYLINMAYVKMYRKGDGGTVIMQDGSEVEISKPNKEAFLQFFKY